MASNGNLAGYTLLERLAKGGMAEVFRARAPAGEARGAGDSDEVVVKRLLPEFRADESYVNLFLDEGKLCVRLTHPNLVKTFKVFKKGADYFMVQELVDGAPLS